MTTTDHPHRSPAPASPAPTDGGRARPGLLASVAVAGPVTFGLATIAAWSANPDTDPVRNQISALGATSVPHPGVITVGFVAMAVGAAAMALLTRRAFRGGAGGLVVPALFAVNAVSTFVAGFARLDCSPADAACQLLEETEAVSGHHVLHNLVSLPVFLTLLVVPLFAARRFAREPRWADLARPSRWLVLATFALTIVVFGGLTSGVDGLLQRALLGLSYGWMVVVALRLDRTGVARARR